MARRQHDDDYAAMTHDDEVRHVRAILAEQGTAILDIPGIWEIVAEEFNNEVLGRWAAEYDAAHGAPGADDDDDDAMEHYEGSDTREDAYYLGVSNTLIYLEERGTITRDERLTVYSDMQGVTEALADDDDAGDDEETEQE